MLQKLEASEFWIRLSLICSVAIWRYNDESLPKNVARMINCFTLVESKAVLVKIVKFFVAGSN